MEGSESRKDVKSRNGEKPVWTLESKGESGMKRRVKRGPHHTGSVVMFMILVFPKSSGLPLKNVKTSNERGRDTVTWSRSVILEDHWLLRGEKIDREPRWKQEDWLKATGVGPGERR